MARIAFGAAGTCSVRGSLIGIRLFLPQFGYPGLNGCAPYLESIDYPGDYLDGPVQPNLATAGRGLPAIQLLTHSIGYLVARQ